MAHATDEAASNVAAVLDPGFRPAVIANRDYVRAVASSGSSEPFAVALEREGGRIARSDLKIAVSGQGLEEQTLRYVERHIKFLLWSRGGCTLHLSGRQELCDAIIRSYSPGGSREFDAEIMARAYDSQFSVVSVAAGDMPENLEMSSSVGGHLDGCRIGFDLGASDYKLAAVVDGEAVFSTEIRWDPSVQTDPSYHYERIASGLKLAAKHMPRVDAIGGSSAGIYVDNRVKVASLFRGVPDDLFAEKVKPMFFDIQKEWNVPLVVVNDGDVTALAGAMSLGTKGMLGIAMGSSEAAGYLNREGCIPGYLNELAFAPVDYSSEAKPDEWSGDVGVGAMYFSQQAVNKLAGAAGISFPDDMPLPDRLKEVQEKVEGGDEGAQHIFETIGVYLGYSLPHYADYYDFENVLILGRVLSGRGGDLIIEGARKVLRAEFPELAESIAIHVPDEKSRRVGQAVAAASLPEIG